MRRALKLVSRGADEIALDVLYYCIHNVCGLLSTSSYEQNDCRCIIYDIRTHNFSLHTIQWCVFNMQ